MKIRFYNLGICLYLKPEVVPIVVVAKSTSTVTAAVVETSLMSFAITLNDSVVPAQLLQTSVSSLMVDRAPVAESICKLAQSLTHTLYENTPMQYTERFD